MKRLFLNCALTNETFENKEEIFVVPVSRILSEENSIYLGSSFMSTFSTDNPLGFDSLSTNKDYKKSISVIKNYIKDPSLITNKTPIVVAQNMANNSIILHNINRMTNSIHPWQEHELNFIFIKKAEFIKRQNAFNFIANDIADKCFTTPNKQSRVVKIDVEHLFTKIYNHARESTSHIIIHFMRNFYIEYIYNQEKENTVRMSMEKFNDCVQEFKNLIFINSLYEPVVKKLKDLSLKDVA